MTPDTWLIVWERDGGHVIACADQEPNLDTGVTAYLDSAGTRDSLLSLTLTDGREYRVLASCITGWSLSTPETRRRELEHEKWCGEERQALRQELGIWEDA